MSEHPYFNRKDVSGFERHEKSLEKTFKGKKTPASGAKRLKGDVQSRVFIVEAKCTSKKSYTLRYDDLAKIFGYGLQSDKLPAMAIRFDFEPKHLLEERDWILLPKYVLEELFSERGIIEKEQRVSR